MEAEAQHKVLTVDGLEIAVVARGDLSSDTVAIMLHGFSSGKNNATNRALLPALDRLAVPSIRFDFRGCYESDGDVGSSTISTGLLDLRSAVSVIPDLDAKRKLFIASSYGAAVALAAANEYHPIAIVARSPMVDIAAAQRERRGKEAMAAWKEKGYLETEKYRLSYDYVTDAESYDLLSVTGPVGMTPVYVVHGDQDEIAPHHFSEAFVAASPRTRELTIIDGADHQYSDREHFDRMIEALEAYISQVLS